MNKHRLRYKTLFKDMDKLFEAYAGIRKAFGEIDTRITNQPQLHYESFTNKEREVLGMLAHGLSTDEIADDLCLSVNTIETHINNIYAKTSIEINPQYKSRITMRIKLILFYLKHIGALDPDWSIKL